MEKNNCPLGSKTFSIVLLGIPKLRHGATYPGHTVRWCVGCNFRRDLTKVEEIQFQKLLSRPSDIYIPR